MITVQKEQFLNAIKAVKTSVGKGSLQPVLSTIHIKSEGGGLILTATDLETSSRAVCEANIAEPIDICVNANSLENIVNMLKDLITLEVSDTMVQIRSGKTHYDVLFIQSSEFPTVEFNLQGDCIILDKEEFVKGVNKTVISTASELGNNILSGVAFTFDKDNGYELAATDGNRLSQVKFETTLNFEGQYIIPKKVLLDVARNIQDEVEIYFTEKTILFKTGTNLFKQNLLNGKYPLYKQLIPTTFKYEAVIDRNELLTALEKVAIMSDDKTNITVFDFNNGSLHLTTSCDNGKAEDTIEISFDGALKIAFNYKYILEGVKAMQSQVVNVGMTGALSACVLKGDFTYLVMPIQQKGQ